MKRVSATSFSCQRGDFTIRGVVYRCADHNKVPIIMSHAFLMNQKMMKKYAKALAKEGYVVFTYDFCGGALFGKSDGTFEDMSIETEKADLEAMMDYVEHFEDVDARRLILFGASQGGFVSCLVAASYPSRINQLILIYPALCIPDDARKGKMQMVEFDPNDIRGTFQSKRFRFSPKYPESAIKIHLDEVIPKILAPLFIVHGSDDKIVDVSYAKRAIELSSNPSSRLIIIEGAGHGFFKKQYQEAIQFIIEYLRQF